MRAEHVAGPNRGGPGRGDPHGGGRASKRPAAKSTRTLVRALRLRLAPDPKRPLSQQKFGDLLGVAWSTVARWEGGRSKPDEKLAGRIERLTRVLDALGDLVRPAGRLAFLEQPHPLLNGIPPADLLGSERGTEAVVDLLESARSGAFA
ncbi:MAG: DUF2384 domain-containing protein [Acidobacteria bacterium]|nr:DUF2384 domain-containing protein [Acidobacteriota bacterium]